jgi:hypothetical protein
MDTDGGVERFKVFSGHFSPLAEPFAPGVRVLMQSCDEVSREKSCEWQ